MSANLESLDRVGIFAALPPVVTESYAETIRVSVAGGRSKLVVLDDDPTGTQTVYDIPVLTEWDVPRLESEFANELPCFYLLTNSRSLPADDAAALNREIAEKLRLAAGSRPFSVVSRSDSTLRGHFPLETDVLDEVIGPFDGTLLIPYFEAGGRYTIDDIHYVAEEDQLVPAAATPFARDASFGYGHSNLCEWIAEKTDGKVPAEAVVSVGIDCIRKEGVDGVLAILQQLNNGAYCVVNAAAPSDLEVVVVAIAKAESQGKRLLFRTGAQFVSTRIGQTEPRAWRPATVGRGGGLVIVGSHVPKSSAQLLRLLEGGAVSGIELEVSNLLQGGSDPVKALADRGSGELKDGNDVVVYTSRELVVGTSAESSLSIARRVSAALVSLVQHLSVRPRYLIGKGGITSSDLATKGLGVKRAMVLGALLPGVPVWETAAETRFPGIPYVVFPGNVGQDESLLEAVALLSGSR